GTATELLTELETLAQGHTTTQAPPAGKGVTLQAPKAGYDITRQKAWPKNGRALSNILRRLAPTLRAIGIGVTFDDRAPGGTRRRIIRLATSTPQLQEQTDAPDEREQEVF